MRMFLTPTWFEAMQTLAHNPPVFGFLVEEMIIQSIAENSITLPDSHIRVPRVVKHFFDPGHLPTTKSRDYAQYVQKTFNFQYVDCVVFVHRNPISKEA